MNFIKIILTSFILASTCFGSEVPTSYESSIALYNRMKNGQELFDRVFSNDKNKSAEDKKFIADLRNSLGNEVLPKAKINGNTIFLGNMKISIISATSAEYLINGKTVKINPSKPLKATFKDIENALRVEYSKLEFLFLNRAEAANPVLIGTAAVYGVGAFIAGGGCAALGVGFGGAYLENLKKTARMCSEIAVTWPYALWTFIDDMKNGNEIIEGSCEKSGPQNQHGNLVKLRTRDDIGKRYMDKRSQELGHYKKEYYFKTDEKSGKARIFIKGHNPKTQLYDQVYEPEAFETLFYNINNQKGGAQALSNYVKNLENVCAKGGSEALNKLIQTDSSVSQGLIKIGKLDSIENQKTGPSKKLPEPSAVR